MFVWVGALLPKEYEDRVRGICNEYNKKIKLDDVAFCLPQHISLKIVFKSNEYLKAVEMIENILIGMKPIEINVKGVNKIPSIIWLEIEENKILREIHDRLDKVLMDELNILQHELDREFKFHSTLYLDKNEQKLLDMFEVIKDEDFSDNIIIDRYVIGISKDGMPGTFKIIREIK